MNFEKITVYHVNKDKECFRKYDDVEIEKHELFIKYKLVKTEYVYTKYTCIGYRNNPYYDWCNEIYHIDHTILSRQEFDELVPPGTKIDFIYPKRIEN